MCLLLHPIPAQPLTSSRLVSAAASPPRRERRAEPFTGSFPELGPPVVENKGVAHRFRAALEAADNIMAGYHNSPDAGGWSVSMCVYVVVGIVVAALRDST